MGRHYSPKFLREDEEVDVTLDESSSLPRYSWLFSDTVRLEIRTVGFMIASQC